MREVEEAKGELSHFRYSGARGSKGPTVVLLWIAELPPHCRWEDASPWPPSPPGRSFLSCPQPSFPYSPRRRGFAVAFSVSAFPEGKRGAPGELGCRKGDGRLADMH